MTISGQLIPRLKPAGGSQWIVSNVTSRGGGGGGDEDDDDDDTHDPSFLGDGGAKDDESDGDGGREEGGGGRILRKRKHVRVVDGEEGVIRAGRVEEVALNHYAEEGFVEGSPAASDP